MQRGDRWGWKRLCFGRWAHDAVCFVELYNRHLCGFVNQCRPNKFHFEKASGSIGEMGPVGARRGLGRWQEASRERAGCPGNGAHRNGEARSISREPSQVKGSSQMKEGTPPKRRHALRVLP